MPENFEGGTPPQESKENEAEKEVSLTNKEIDYLKALVSHEQSGAELSMSVLSERGTMTPRQKTQYEGMDADQKMRESLLRKLG